MPFIFQDICGNHIFFSYKHYQNERDMRSHCGCSTIVILSLKKNFNNVKYLQRDNLIIVFFVIIKYYSRIIDRKKIMGGPRGRAVKTANLWQMTKIYIPVSSLQI